MANTLRVQPLNWLVITKMKQHTTKHAISYQHIKFDKLIETKFIIFVQKLGIDRRYQIHLKSHTGEINVLLVNKDPMNNRPVVTPVPPPMSVTSAQHNTTLSKDTQQIPSVTEKITTIAEKPPEKEKSLKRPVLPMETSTTGW